ncbi:MAG: Nif3-like dinuclear metal center hexameric protein [Dysgonamonadaceae bacterium]|jgi:dinuclear metal center YbgI/SA1388 family protein|nr:Nif3-like dinuclear metal center hexameric protein [Dysgonamonadaceae bacterium]
MKISEIIEQIEALAPLPLQESFDNSGLQTGDISQEVKGILLCIDVTEAVMDEAVTLGCNLVISHHPLLFKPLRTLTGRNYIERSLIKACKNDIAVYSSHTSLDNAENGVNYHLAEKIGLKKIRILSPKKDSLLKLVTFVPTAFAEPLRSALFKAGAGVIGNYDSCSFNVEGCGTFRAGESANPFVGAVGESHSEPEIRLETVLPAYRKSAVLRALMTSHPYEEPAFDFYRLDNDWIQAGSGAIGELPEPIGEADFLQSLKTVFNLQCLKHSPLTGRKISRVALCGGSGAFLIPEAVAAGADIFITGEARYNDYYDVENRLLLAVIGHHESEISTKELIYKALSSKAADFPIHLSKTDLNPVGYL